MCTCIVHLCRSLQHPKYDSKLVNSQNINRDGWYDEALDPQFLTQSETHIKPPSADHPKFLAEKVV